jgi:ATP phosphoribosyltransferase
MQTIEEFVDRLVEEKNFDTKDEEVIAQIKSDLMKRIGDRIDAMIMTNIKPEKLAEFSEVLDTNDETKITGYIRQQIPDIDEKTAGVLLSFRTSYIS